MPAVSGHALCVENILWLTLPEVCYSIDTHSVMRSGSPSRKSSMVSSFTRKMAQMARPLGWLCMVYLLIHGPSPGLVLCFGANGHVAAEAPHSRCPHPTSQSQAPCLDLPLVSMSSPEHPLVIAPPATAQSGAPVAVLASVLLPFAAVASDSVRPPLPASTPPAVWWRTDILLI